MTSREWLVVKVGAQIALTAFIGLRVLPVGVRWAQRLHEEVTSRRQLVRSARESLGRSRALEDSGRVVRKRIEALAPRILTGAASSQAAVDLSERLAVLADHARVRLERAEPIEDTVRAGSLRRVTVHATVEGDTRGVLALMRGIGASDAALAVREMRIVAQDPRSAEDQIEVLHGELTIGGWFLEQGRR